MDKLVCLECKEPFENEVSLHRHLRAHKLLMSEYYFKHFPRVDKFTGEPIKFRDKESYFYNDFNNKENLKKWLEQVTEDEACVYIKSYFFARKERKNLKYAPTQTELRSLPIPGMIYLNKLFGSYKKLCDSVGLQVRHTKSNFTKSPVDISGYKIYYDTREQNPLSFSIKSERQMLPFADYRLSDDKVTHNCYIERKNVADFHGTFAKSLGRFKREIEKARNSGAYVIVITEGRFEDIVNFANNGFLNKPLGGGEQRDEKPVISSHYHVFKGMREIMEEFDDVQFLFVDNRDEASRVIEKIFSSDGEYKDCDLQYMWDLGLL
jgi:hypothetical protein